MEQGCKVVWLVEVRGHCKNCLALGWSKLVGTLVWFGGQEDCKEQAGVLAGRREKGFLAVALVGCRKLQQQGGLLSSEEAEWELVGGCKMATVFLAASRNHLEFLLVLLWVSCRQTGLEGPG